jgi:hypothetical protein
MSTDPYPEVSVDESGIVPPQAGRAPDWPKKIRTLTAAELDRLTIDSSGRFYWDGKLVNYEPPEAREAGPKPDEGSDESAMDIADRDTYELDDHKVPEPIEGADLPHPIETHPRRREVAAMELDVSHDEVEERHPSPAEIAVARAMAGAQVIRGTERMRLSMSIWQSLGAIVLVLGLLIGATGVAAYGWVVAHDWGCRIGLVKAYCPPAAVKADLRKPRTDIPA